MPLSSAQDAQGCHFYLAEGCHFYPALTSGKSDNKNYVKYSLANGCYLKELHYSGLATQSSTRRPGAR